MKWLSGMRYKGSREKEPIDGLIERIEKHAPKKYREKREIFYYNYRIMGLYKKPLIELLQTLAQRNHKNLSSEEIAGGIVEKLKNFYDPKDKLSLEEALNDRGFLKKHREIYSFFYGREAPSKKELDKAQIWGR